MVGPTMAITRLRAVGTCGEGEPPSVEGKTLSSLSSLPPSPLRNGLTSRGARDTGKINGYTPMSNGHVHVSSDVMSRRGYTISSFPRPSLRPRRTVSAASSRIVSTLSFDSVTWTVITQFDKKKKTPE